MVLYDWQRGKIPFFALPPDHTAELPAATDAKVLPGLWPATSGSDGGRVLSSTPCLAVKSVQNCSDAHLMRSLFETYASDRSKG